MPTLIIFDSKKFFYEKDIKTFNTSERFVPFATEYELKNPATGVSKTFVFSHSTGPEFDPTTKWIYNGPDGLILSVWNDKDITFNNSLNYLKAKTR